MSKVITRPTRTPSTWLQPSPCSAVSTALPWTSSTPGLRKTWTTAFIARSLDAALDNGGHLLHHAQAPGHFGVALDDVAEVAPEAVLVELLGGRRIIKQKTVGADLVGQDHAREIVLPHPTVFDLEVHQGDSHGAEQAGEEVVHAQGGGHHVVDFLGRGPVEGGDVLLGHHWVAELVVLEVEFDDRTGQGLALGQAESPRQRAGGDVAADDLERDDLHLLDQLLAQVQPPDEVILHADRVQADHHIFADSIVDDALTLEYRLLRAVEGGGVVLEILDQGAGLGPLVENLGLSLIDLFSAGHDR